MAEPEKQRPYEFFLDFQWPYSCGRHSSKELSIYGGYFRAEATVGPSSLVQNLKFSISYFPDGRHPGIIVCMIFLVFQNSDPVFKRSMVFCRLHESHSIEISGLSALEKIIGKVYVFPIPTCFAFPSMAGGQGREIRNDERKNQLYSYKAIQSLFKSDKFSDVTMNVQGTEFPAHRFILASASSVFDTMFSEDYKENATKEVKIRNFKVETILELVRFIYTGEKPDFHSIDLVRELYAASDYYEVEELRNHCECELFSIINDGNALDILLLAETHSNDQLKKKALTFIFENPSSVANVEKCADIINKRPQLLTLLFERKKMFTY